MHSRAYTLEYGTATWRSRPPASRWGRRVAIVDDVLATGGTVAARDLLADAGAQVTEAAVVMELGGSARP